MKKKLFKILLISVFFVGFSSCSDKDDNKKEEEPKEEERPALAGTKWKLSKLIHTETKVEREIFVGDEVFTQFVPTMDFETDTTGKLRLHTTNDDYSALAPLDFNINKIYTTERINWFNKTYALMGDNIEMYMDVISLFLLGYKVEDSLLKLYHPSIGFFDVDENCEIEKMYSQYGVCTDTNWYNCIVWEEIT